jgi:hypothetical protein
MAFGQNGALSGLHPPKYQFTGFPLLVLVILLYGADGSIWISDTALRIIITVAIALVIIFSIR